MYKTDICCFFQVKLIFYSSKYTHTWNQNWFIKSATGRSDFLSRFDCFYEHRWVPTNGLRIQKTESHLEIDHPHIGIPSNLKSVGPKQSLHSSATVGDNDTFLRMLLFYFNVRFPLIYLLDDKLFFLI